jgi:hypothetical protein
MGRYIFTERDLEPLRGLIQSPLGKAVVESTVPIKQFTAAPPHQETTDVALPVPVQSRENPEGVPLHDILSAVQEKVPSVKALAVRAGNLVVSFERAPSRTERDKLERALTSPQTFERVRAARPRDVALRSLADLERILADPATSDAEWLKAFRSYAVAKLLPARRPVAGEAASEPPAPRPKGPRSPRRGGN